MNISQLQEFQSRTMALATPYATPVTTIVALLLNEKARPVGLIAPQAAAHWDENFHKKAKQQVEEYKNYLMIDCNLAVEMARRIYINRCQNFMRPTKQLFDTINGYRYVESLSTVIPESTAYHIFFYTLDALNKYEVQISALIGQGHSTYQGNRVFNRIVEETYENYISNNNPGTMNRFYDQIMDMITELVRELLQVMTYQGNISLLFKHSGITPARAMRCMLMELYNDSHLAETIVCHFYDNDFFDVLTGEEKESEEDEESMPSVENFSDDQELLEALYVEMKEQGFEKLYPHNLKWMEQKDPELFEVYNISTDEEISLEGFFSKVGQGIKKTVRKIIRLIVRLLNNTLRLLSKPFGLTPKIKLEDDEDAREKWRTEFNSLLHEKIEDIPSYVADPKQILIPVGIARDATVNARIVVIEKSMEFKNAWAEGKIELCQRILDSYKKAIEDSANSIHEVATAIVFDPELKYPTKQSDVDKRTRGDFYLSQYQAASYHLAGSLSYFKKLEAIKVRSRNTPDEVLRRCYSIAEPKEWEDVKDKALDVVKEIQKEIFSSDENSDPVTFDWNPSERPMDKDIAKIAQEFNALYLEHFKTISQLGKIAEALVKIYDKYAYPASQMGVDARHILDLD